MKDWKRVSQYLSLLALGSSLGVVGCGGDDSFTPVCPTVEDCTTPAQRPSSDAGDPDDASNADDEADEGASEDEGTE